ncbi:MAG: hypothetical protein K8F91_27610, partial [Candidatus Obscuribacterales bacterium]|nr:hypothetical protein [Candidatus Obscuribacterales bacterium]
AAKTAAKTAAKARTKPKAKAKTRPRTYKSEIVEGGSIEPPSYVITADNIEIGIKFFTIIYRISGV